MSTAFVNFTNYTTTSNITTVSPLYATETYVTSLIVQCSIVIVLSIILILIIKLQLEKHHQSAKAKWVSIQSDILLPLLNQQLVIILVAFCVLGIVMCTILVLCIVNQQPPPVWFSKLVPTATIYSYCIYPLSVLSMSSLSLNSIAKARLCCLTLLPFALCYLIDASRSDVNPYITSNQLVYKEIIMREFIFLVYITLIIFNVVPAKWIRPRKSAHWLAVSSWLLVALCLGQHILNYLVCFNGCFAGTHAGLSNNPINPINPNVLITLMKTNSVYYMLFILMFLCLFISEYMNFRVNTLTAMIRMLVIFPQILALLYSFRADTL